ncbi:hypothetical protein M5K25_002358 [Dendrobium thyrsiflorum]|uniref:Retrovirus-related Pol polyprotein from transposon TNT 1-94 n=1 Tax=Dendrobium thyrsiflorum TaxID=117978 RepID=A0ABD0W5N2_DENTH
MNDFLEFCSGSWRFHCQGFEGFLNGSSVYPPRSINIDSGQLIPNPDYTNWTLLDQNLAAALYSVVSSTILPYVLSVEQCNDIWTTLDRQLQSSTRSRIIQIKNELHYLSMKDKSMTQYLLDIKAKVDSLAAAGAPMDVEDVIHYTLNGLPSTYQAFKTAIRTNLQPLSLDDLYTLLCSEELNLAHETTKELQSLQLSDNTMALTASRGRGRDLQSRLLEGVTATSIEEASCQTILGWNKMSSCLLILAVAAPRWLQCLLLFVLSHIKTPAPLFLPIKKPQDPACSPQNRGLPLLVPPASRSDQPRSRALPGPTKCPRTTPDLGTR